MTTIAQGTAPEPLEPDRNCPLCPRLAAFRNETRAAEPRWFNAPVPSFGQVDARLLVVGLAPGLRGANRTGRPFTGDHAGDLLYATLREFGFASGDYHRSADDGLCLDDCLVTNAVRCVPPQNKPLPAEIATCRSFLAGQITALTKLKALVVLGRIAHESTLRALGVRIAAAPFGHGRRYDIARDDAKTRLTLFASYHCSRYNTSTGILTETMFRDVFRDVRAYLDTVE